MCTTVIVKGPFSPDDWGWAEQCELSVPLLIFVVVIINNIMYILLFHTVQF